MHLRPLVATMAVLGLVGCTQPAVNDVGSPESALTQLTATLTYGAPEDVWDFLGPETREVLEARAAQAEAMGIEVGHPADLLVASWLPNEADIREVSRLETHEATTTLQIETYLGHTSEVELIRTEAGWQVELALPPHPPNDVAP